ncbi:hypothetical protein [Rubripirellula lacrimiformis]|uniref:hypothetical protein n=1 Tax=Rubripirellula lacrimiformis TaxID=1930273 RepID=UPI0011A37438|nr:hypothetical protein [Rubripirellula lacrimiformis]
MNFNSTSGLFCFPLVDSATYIEYVVATYKAMLEGTDDGKMGKLIFGRVRADSVPIGGSCVIEHRRKIGKQFFEAKLLCNDEKIGSLYFGQQ